MQPECDSLKLENQLCFPLYAAAREVTKRYRPYLDAIGLTYTQYIAMMVLWEKKQCSVKALGDALSLDSGTLTPVLKSLEAKGFVRRRRSEEDERVVIAAITPAGEALREKAEDIPQKISACIALEPQEAAALHSLLGKLLRGADEA